MALFTDRYLNFFSGKRAPRGQCFLWPVWIWEILAPDPKQQSLNLFQRSILGLIKAKKSEPALIAEWLGLDKEMVLYIITGQLQPNGWLDNKFQLTSQGLAMLQEDHDRRGVLTTAYIFQDALSGKLWPRVTQQLSDIDATTHNTDGYPEFLTNRETGWTEKPFVIPCKSNAVMKPEMQEIRTALRQGNNAIHNTRIRGELAYHQQEFRADEIDLLNDLPFRAYIMCWVIEDKGEVWNISDPLAITSFGEFLREDVYIQAQQSQKFASKLKNFIGEVPEKETYEEMLQRLNASVDLTQFTEFAKASRIPNLESCLGALLRRQQLLEEALDDKSIRFEDCDDVVTQAQKIFECSFKWMLAQWKVPNRHFIKQDWRFDEIRCAIEEIAGSFLTDADLDDLARQKAGSIFRAATHKEPNVSLRPLLAATLFTLPANPSHPLLQFARDDLAVSSILYIAKERNAVAHASDKQTSKETALECARFTTGWIKKLLNTLE